MYNLQAAGLSPCQMNCENPTHAKSQESKVLCAFWTDNQVQLLCEHLICLVSSRLQGICTCQAATSRATQASSPGHHKLIAQDWRNLDAMALQA